MTLQTELLITKPLQPGHEVALALLLTREYAAWFMDEQVFRPGGISDQQFNVLRILRGGPKPGYLVCEIKRRMISRNADAPRLIDRLARQGLVRRKENPADRRGTRIQITAKGLAKVEEIGPLHAAAVQRFTTVFTEEERRRFVGYLERLRDGFRSALDTDSGTAAAADPKAGRSTSKTPAPKEDPSTSAG